MAIYDNFTSQPEGVGISYPQDYYVKSLNFLTSNGNKMDLKKILREFSYYEDIYTFTVSGYIKIEDSQGFIESLQLTGNEYIEINFGKIKSAANSTDQIFRVYKIGDRQASQNMNTQLYTLHFCSEELIVGEQIKIAKSYTGWKISDIVTDVLSNQLKVKSSNINNVEETTGLYDFVVPRMKPFEVISWVSTYARPKSTGTIGADMLFFETKDGFNFRSLQSMFKDDVYATYKYQQQNLADKNQSLQEKVNTVLAYEVSKTFDVMNDITSGTFANQLISIDPLMRSFNNTTFDYDKFKDVAESLNNKGITNDAQNRFGESLNQAYNSVTKVATGNANQSNVPYIKNKEGGFAKDIYIETYVPQRTAQLNLANYNVVKMAIPGDPGITAGRVIEFNLMSVKPTTNKRDLDKFYSGKYLVTAVRHVIQPENGMYQTILEIAKDSSKSQYQGVDNSNPSYKESINS